jgi:uncharacterized protein YcfJ
VILRPGPFFPLQRVLPAASLVRYRTDSAASSHILVDVDHARSLPEFAARRVRSSGDFRMNKSMITGLVVGGVAVTAAGAFAGYRAMDDQRYAEVLNVEPLTQTVRTPRQVYSDEIVTHQAPVKDPKRVTGAVLGAVAGGVLGNQIGGGSGQTVATVAGAAAGGYAGSKVQKNMQENNTTQTVEQRCRTVYDSIEKPDGYEVRYRLGDQEGTVRMDQDPGQRIPVENGQLVLAHQGNRQ